MRWVITLLAIMFSAHSCAAAILAVNIKEPRTFGYFIGDVLQRQVDIVTDGNTEFLAESLPRPGSLTYWLDLVGVDHSTSHDSGRTINRVTLKYQIFYSALSATELDIPAFPLKFRETDASGKSASATDESAKSASIPALKLTLSPLRDIVLSDLMPNQTTEVSDVLRPNAESREIPIARLKNLIALTLAGLAFSVLGLLHHYAIWPFARRAHRPFTVADRKIREISSAVRGDEGYRASLLILHRAFDQAFGRRLFATDSSVFLEKNTTFSNLTPKLSAFFEASHLFFFGDDRSAAKRIFSLDDVAGLASDLAREERAAS